MGAGRCKVRRNCAFGLADEFIRIVRAVEDWRQLRSVMRDVADEMGFRHFALITHEDLRSPKPGQIDLRDYPDGASSRIIDGLRYRRDPVMRGCAFADSAFIWSQLGEIIDIDHHDRIAFELGGRDGLNEGITVPCAKLGHPLGSCTFAGLKSAPSAELLLGPAQLIGVFAFQRARALANDIRGRGPVPRLEPRMRDCILLAGQGLRDKLIGHRLGLTHRTVESYLRDARKLFGARDRTELVVAALLSGEITLHEVRPRQAP
jgi:DNA-binding CsgD family transcriptional regulator